MNVRMFFEEMRILLSFKIYLFQITSFQYFDILFQLKMKTKP